MSKGLIFIIILLLIVVPKTDLVDVPGFRQAIRIDDLLTILLLVTCALDNRMRNISLLGKNAGVFFIFYLLFSSLIHGLIYGFSVINFVFTIRYLQYFIVGGILYKFAFLYPNYAFYIMLSFLFTCFLFIPFPGAYAVGRFNAFTRGPWELGSMIVFFLISILVTRKNNGYIVLSSAIILSLAKARIQLLGFFYYIFTKMGMVYRVSAVLLGTIFAGYLFTIFNLEKFSVEAFETLWFLFNKYEKSDFNAIASSYNNVDHSLLERILIWKIFILEYIVRWPFSLFFGIGPGTGGIVVDGGYIRWVCEFGLIGSFFLYNVFKRLWLAGASALVIPFLIMSLTNDLLTSFKIFIAFSLSAGLLVSSKNGCTKEYD